MPAKLYDWGDWFAHRRFTLHKGMDYDCSQSSISQQVRNAASERGLRVSVIEGEDSVTVVVVERKEEKKCPA